jgi:hypothetical protein
MKIIIHKGKDKKFSSVKSMESAISNIPINVDKILSRMATKLRDKTFGKKG